MQAFQIRHESRMQIASSAIQSCVKHSQGQTINKIPPKNKTADKSNMLKNGIFRSKIRFTAGKPSCKGGFLENN